MPVYLLTMRSKSKYKRTVEFLKRHADKNGQFTWGEVGNLTVRVDSANTAILKAVRNRWTIIKQEGQPDNHEVDIQEGPYRCRIPGCTFLSGSLDVLAIHHQTHVEEEREKVQQVQEVTQAPVQPPTHVIVDVPGEAPQVVRTAGRKATLQTGPMSKGDQIALRSMVNSGKKVKEIAEALRRKEATIEGWLVKANKTRPGKAAPRAPVPAPAPEPKAPARPSYTVKGLMVKTVASIKETQALLAELNIMLDEHLVAVEKLFALVKRD